MLLKTTSLHVQLAVSHDLLQPFLPCTAEQQWSSTTAVLVAQCRAKHVTSLTSLHALVPFAFGGLRKAKVFTLGCTSYALGLAADGSSQCSSPGPTSTPSPPSY